MAYTALEKMRAKNRAAYGKDVGPAQPALFGGGLERTDLKSAALRFLDPFGGIAVTGEENALMIVDDVAADIKCLCTDILQILDAFEFFSNLIQ